MTAPTSLYRGSVKGKRLYYPTVDVKASSSGWNGYGVERERAFSESESPMCFVNKI